MLDAALNPHGKTPSVRALLRRGAYVETIVAPGPGRLRLSWNVAPAGRRRLTDRTVLLASATTMFDESGPIKIELRLTTGGRRALSNQPHLTIIAHGAFTPAGQHPIRLTRVFTLGR